MNDLPVSEIDTALAIKVLEPIWKKTPETASRVRQRCEQVIDWAQPAAIARKARTRSCGAAISTSCCRSHPR